MELEESETKTGGKAGPGAPVRTEDKADNSARDATYSQAAVYGNGRLIKREKLRSNKTAGFALSYGVTHTHTHTHR